MMDGGLVGVLPSQRPAPDVLCCMCGVSMKPNRVNTCANCLQTTNDVTSEFAKNGVLLKCKRCLRYQKQAQGWVFCANESKALLALCLKKIKGLQKVSLVDANFIWTEEHSKRVKVKVTVQKEVAPGVVLQQQCVVEFVVQNKMCDECHAAEASLTWDTVVQVRQHVDHKRTFLLLEQLILKHKEDARTINVKSQPDGVDFFFGKKNDAARFRDFLETVVPIMRTKEAKQLLSTDVKNNIAYYNYTFAVDIIPTCKDDLVFLPPATARRLGNISQLALCSQVTNTVRFIDPLTCQVTEMSGEVYTRAPFQALLNAGQLVSYTVLDVQLMDMPKRREREQQHQAQEEPAETASVSDRKRRRKTKAQAVITSSGANVSSTHRLALIEVARDSDLGANDVRFLVTSHLGYVLQAGDSVLGYDLSIANMNDNDLDGFDIEKLPQVVLVRKHYPKWRKLDLSKERAWKLRSLVNELPEAGSLAKTKDGDDEKLDRDRELFMRDIEEDAELRSRIALYKNAAFVKKAIQADAEVEEDLPAVAVEELLEDLRVDDDDEEEEEGNQDSDNDQDDDDESDT